MLHRTCAARNPLPKMDAEAPRAETRSTIRLPRPLSGCSQSAASTRESKAVNQSDLIDHVARATGMTKADAGRAVEAVLGGIADEVAAGKEVRLNGFGIFSVAERAAREGRNPQTGQTIQIAASKAAKFSPAKALKDRLNPG